MSLPTTFSLNLVDGFSSKTKYQYNSNNMPSKIVTNNYQNGILYNVNTQTFTYNNGVETINWTDEDKTFNTTSSGTFTSYY